MTTAVAGPATAPRPRRGAAGRRALQVVLFLGGLLALGLLFGARAQADQQPDQQPVRAVAEAATDAVIPEAATPPVPEREMEREKRGEDAVPATRPAPRPLPSPRGDAARTAPHPVAEPVRNTVRQATRPVSEAVGAGGASEVVEVVERTVGTAVSGFHGITADLPVPGEWPLPVPSLPAVPEAPQTGPVPVSDAPGSAAPGPSAAPRPVSASVPHITAAPAAFPASSEAAAAPHREVAADHRPAPRGPFVPDGGQSHSAPAEAHPPRGGDQQAGPLADGTSFGLVRGAGLPATVAPVRDRSGDILEFPG
ncbi:hypothetical protein [Streptomyces sp. NPDC050422]|uniref:hypothetical protein n=1 Tax=Streptomyces sp. NPDC050422 TaxID=3365614 RepID=UPI0037B610BC